MANVITIAGSGGTETRYEISEKCKTCEWYDALKDITIRDPKTIWGAHIPCLHCRNLKYELDLYSEV